MIDGASPPPGAWPAERWFEDYIAGSMHELGRVRVRVDADSDEIVEFARRWDPQPMHTDPAAAASSPIGGLIASGWHTAGMMMSLYAVHYLSPASSVTHRAWKTCVGRPRCVRGIC